MCVYRIEPWQPAEALAESTEPLIGMGAAFGDELVEYLDGGGAT